MHLNNRPELLLLGDERRTRMARLVRFLESRVRLTMARHPRDLTQRADLSASFAWIVLAPEIRDEFSVADVQQLTVRWPLAVLLLLVDSWLEGETRSGRAWPGVKRLYWHELEPQWELLTASDEGGSLGDSSLRWSPPTQTAEETLTRSVALETAPRGQSVLIASERLDTRASLQDLCRAAGWQAVEAVPGASAVVESADRVDVVLYDGVPDQPRRAEQLQWLRRHWPDAPIVMLVDFPRDHEEEAAEQLGVARVLGKPFRIEELLVTLHQLARR